MPCRAVEGAATVCADREGLATAISGVIVMRTIVPLSGRRAVGRGQQKPQIGGRRRAGLLLASGAVSPISGRAA